MKLPSKLTLGNKPKRPNLVLGGHPKTDTATAPEEEKKAESPNYHSAEIKLMIIAIEVSWHQRVFV